MKYPKRLIEVDLPIKRISAHARREKSIRHGHISTLHIWWARRPLAACRAVICAALWPDPADPFCPPAFREAAEKIILTFARRVTSDTKLANDHCSPETFKKWSALISSFGVPPSGGSTSDSSARSDTAAAPPPEGGTPNLQLRTALLDFIADFANWDNSTVREYLETSRALTQAAHEALGGAPGTRPLVVDPFCGGGSIPIEALRVGADAFASDLNPVPVLLNKVVLEYIPKYGQRLADEVRKWGEWMYARIEDELGKFYPKSKEGDPVGAYLWARTILSEAPTGDDYPVELPLLRSMLLLKKHRRYQALRWVRDKAGKVETEIVTVTYADGRTLKVRRPQMEVFEPASPTEVENGTSSGGAATCPVSGYTTSVESVRRQLLTRRGGAEDARLVCVVASNSKGSGRLYLAPTPIDTEAAIYAKEELKRQISEHVGDVSMVPDGQLNHLRGFFNVVLYGMTTWGDLFSPRQALGVSDPPYYAAIPYADLPDFFYSWLKRSVGHLHPDLFGAPLSPKDEECVSLSHRAAMYRHKDGPWFEQTMAKACAESRRIAKPSGISVFVFANKETAGWEAMLGALISSGWITTGSWPVDTEMGNCLRAQNSAALASSVHLVCRPRENPDGSVRTDEIGDWRDVLQELPRRIHEWMPRLAEEGVVGADAIFACLGPALEIVSRYSRVEKASGETARLLPVAERTRHLFGKDQEDSSLAKAKKKKKDVQMGLNLFSELTESNDAETTWGEKTVQKPGATVLDRIHQSMILFAASRGEALKRFLVDEGIGADHRFWGLAQALSALYPARSEEKRWVDGVLARKKGLGF